MAEIYTSGAWTPKPGEEEELLAASTEFARWAAGSTGRGRSGCCAT